ncbi:MAG: carboxymuconolactone decarboxylase family protein [Salinirussus sp.]
MGDETLTDRQAEIKAQFLDEIGYWTDGYQAALRTDPEFFDRFRALAGASYERGTLHPRIRELLLLAVNIAVSHLSTEGIRTHMENALDHGATYDEVRQVITLASGQGFHAATVGFPVLLDVADIDASGELTGDALAAKEHFEAERGWFSPFLEDLARIDPAFLDAYTDLSAHSRQVGPLDPKTIEYVAIAEDAAATHMYVDGLEAHIENALALGCPVEEIAEVLELVSVIGLQSFGTSATILEELAAERGLDTHPDRS